MKLILIGATGRTGLRTVATAVARGANVRALVRDPQKLGALQACVDVAVGDVHDLDFLIREISSDDVVISALGARANAPGEDTVGRGTATLVTAMERVGTRRFLGVVGAGVLLNEAGVPRHTLPDYPARFLPISVQHQAALNACERSALSWVLVGCPQIVDGDATGRLRVQRHQLPAGIGRVTTGDLAELLVGEALSPTVSCVRLGVNEG